MAAGQSAGLEAVNELVPLSHLDAGAVVVGDRVERAVEVTPPQRDDGLELVPGSADVLERVRDADELHWDLLPLDLRELAHAPRWVYQPPLAPSWKTTVFSPLSSTSSKYPRTTGSSVHQRSTTRHSSRTSATARWFTSSGLPFGSASTRAARGALKRAATRPSARAARDSPARVTTAPPPRRCKQNRNRCSPSPDAARPAGGSGLQRRRRAARAGGRSARSAPRAPGEARRPEPAA